MADVYTQSTTPQFSALLTTYVRAELLGLLRQGGLVNLPPGTGDLNTYAVGTDDSYVLPGMADLQVALNPLAELVSPAIEPIDTYLMNLSTIEYARSIGFSSKILRQQKFPVAQTISERVAYNLSETVDEVARLAWQAAHAGEKIYGTGIAAIKTDDLINAVTYLQNANVPPLDDGNYACITSPWVVADLKKEAGEKSWNAAQTNGPGELIKGSLGQWHGVKFYGGSRNTPASGTTVVSILAGKASIAVADLSSLQTFAVLPHATTDDPVAQRGVASWRARLGAKPVEKRARHDDAAIVYSHVKFNSLLTKV